MFHCLIWRGFIVFENVFLSLLIDGFGKKKSIYMKIRIFAPLFHLYKSICIPRSGHDTFHYAGMGWGNSHLCSSHSAALRMSWNAVILGDVDTNYLTNSQRESIDLKLMKI